MLPFQEISFSTVDHNPESKRGTMVAALIKSQDTSTLEETASEKHSKMHHATTVARTDFTLYNTMKLVSAWLNLRVIGAIFELVLPSIESIRIVGCNHPTAAFIRDKLSTAPNLESIHLGGDVDRAGTICTAFAKALRVDKDGDGVEDANKRKPTPTRFPSLRRLAYPAEDSTYNTGRGRTALLKAANRRGICASRVHNIEYKVKGSQRRAVFAKRAYW
ncbi:hypothetical protein B0H19DRAFT_1058353 [Mycena capillaripes]|nr:hypothetical protein B0H19DRAFT_1058353 [Mycena capillaripes]